MKPTQRFVAGAICPQCGEQDSLLIDTQDQSIECVECHFSQSPKQRDQLQKAKSEKDGFKVKAGEIIQITNLEE